MSKRHHRHLENNEIRTIVSSVCRANTVKFSVLEDVNSLKLHSEVQMSSRYGFEEEGNLRKITQANENKASEHRAKHTRDDFLEFQLLQVFVQSGQSAGFPM